MARRLGRWRRRRLGRQLGVGSGSGWPWAAETEEVACRLGRWWRRRFVRWPTGGVGDIASGVGTGCGSGRRAVALARVVARRYGLSGGGSGVSSRGK